MDKGDFDILLERAVEGGEWCWEMQGENRSRRGVNGYTYYRLRIFGGRWIACAAL